LIDREPVQRFVNLTNLFSERQEQSWSGGLLHWLDHAPQPLPPCETAGRRPREPAGAADPAV